MKDILNNKKLLYFGIAALVLGVAFAFGTYAYYRTTITGTATGTVLAYNCTVNNQTQSFELDLGDLYPGLLTTKSISISANIYTNATVAVTAYNHMGISGSQYEKLAIYTDDQYTDKMGPSGSVINTVVVPNTPTVVPLYIKWDYAGVDNYDSTKSPTATITVTCNQNVTPTP